MEQLGDYANVGTNVISLVDADSFWVDGYFEETSLEPIRVGDPADVKLMGYARACAAISTALPAASMSLTRPTGKGLPMSDLHLGAPRAMHPGARPHR